VAEHGELLPSSPVRAELIDFTIERQRHRRFVGRKDVLAQLDDGCSAHAAGAIWFLDWQSANRRESADRGDLSFDNQRPLSGHRGPLRRGSR